MEKKINYVYLISWDSEISYDPNDFPGIKFIKCERDDELFSQAKKFSLTIVIINNKSTIADKGKGGITLVGLKKFLIRNKIPNIFLRTWKSNLKNELKKFTNN